MGSSAYLGTMMTSSNRNIFRVTGHLCGEFSDPGEFTAQKPVTRIFDVFFDLRLNKRLCKQWWGWWFETLSRQLWCHRNERGEIVTDSVENKGWKPQGYTQKFIKKTSVLLHSYITMEMNWLDHHIPIPKMQKGEVSLVNLNSDTAVDHLDSIKLSTRRHPYNAVYIYVYIVSVPVNRYEFIIELQHWYL